MNIHISALGTTCRVLSWKTISSLSRGYGRLVCWILPQKMASGVQLDKCLVFDDFEKKLTFIHQLLWIRNVMEPWVKNECGGPGYRFFALDPTWIADELVPNRELGCQ